MIHQPPQPASSSSASQHLLSYEIPLPSTQQPPSYDSLPAVKSPPTYHGAPPTSDSFLTQLLTSSQGAVIPTMQQTSPAAIFVPDVVLISGAGGTALTQSASLPRPQLELRPQPDVESQSAADFIASLSGLYLVLRSLIHYKTILRLLIQKRNIIICYAMKMSSKHD